MKTAGIYIPIDRRQAMLEGKGLPDRANGAALIADISGFTQLTDVLVRDLGPKPGAHELTRQLNAVYGALITEVHRYQGSVIGFSGDAITCWFDNDPGQRSIACALAMQQAIGQFAAITTPNGATVTVAMKAAVASGPVRRFRVGDPNIQYLDVLAGATVDDMALAEEHAGVGEVVVTAEVIAQLGEQIKIAQWRQVTGTDHAYQSHFSAQRPPQVEPKRLAVVAGLTAPVAPSPWPVLATPPKKSGLKRLSTAQIRPWLLPPVYKRLRAGQGRFLAEIRPAVALFLRFGGLDYDGDEAAGEKLDAYICWVQNVLAYYEGYLIQLTIGDKGSYLYAAFGAPLAHDDDPARAVAAALELRSLPPTLEFIKEVQIGISQGRMRAGAYGGPTRRTYGVLGDEVNVAAGLMQQAEPGQIMVSQRIAQAIAASYHLKYIGPVKVKGKQDLVPVSLVLERRWPSPQRPATIFTHPLVGRDQEMAQLEQLLDSVLAGHGQILRLAGVAGIGKSHLAAAFIERALSRNFRTGVGACQSTTQGVAYYPWRQVFRALFELNDEPAEGEDPAAWTARQIAQVEAMVTALNPAWLVRLPLLGDLLDLPIPDNETTAAFEPKLRREALFALAAEIVRAWAGAQPLFLLVEDIHWVDEASRELTLALGRAIAGAPVLLALVHRPQDQTSLPELGQLAHHYHLEVGELTLAGISTLVTNYLQGQVSPLVLDLIQARAQGNPFFSEELVDALQETGTLQRQADGVWALSESALIALRQANCLTNRQGQWRLASNAPLESVDLNIPDTIQGIVLSRLDRLPERHKLTMKVASVIGHTFELEVLAQAHPLQPGQEALLQQIKMLEERDLVRIELPQPQVTYMFKHNITQEVAYETLPENQLHELHRAVGRALEALRPEAVERLAYHYRLGEVRDKTLLYLDKAARKTQREYANETALNYYNQALALEERWTWRQGQIEILHLLGRRDEEAISLKVLAANPVAPVFEVAYLWGQYHEAVSNYVQAQAAVEQALAAGRALDNLAAEVRCLAQLGLIAYRQGYHEQAHEWYRQALNLFHAKQNYPPEVIRAFIQAFNGLGTIHYTQGEFARARACYTSVLSLSRRIGDRQGEANTLFGLGVIAFYQRQFSKARQRYLHALKIQKTIGDRPGEGMSLYSLAQVMSDAGDYSQAQAYLLEALTILQSTGNRWSEVTVWNDLGILYQELGDLAQAQSCLEQGLKLAREIGAEEAKAPYLLSNLGLVMRDQGNLALAQKLLDEGLALVQKIDNKRQMAFFLSYLGSVHLQAGQPGQAIERAWQALKLWDSLGLRWRTTDDLATLASAYLAAGEPAKALIYAGQTLAILNECNGEGPEFPQRDYLIGYQVLKAAGQREEAQAALQAAYNLVMHRAEKITHPTLRQSFLEQVTVNRNILAEYANQERYDEKLPEN